MIEWLDLANMNSDKWKGVSCM